MLLVRHSDACRPWVQLTNSGLALDSSVMNYVWHVYFMACVCHMCAMDCVCYGMVLQQPWSWVMCLCMVQALSTLADMTYSDNRPKEAEEAAREAMEAARQVGGWVVRVVGGGCMG